MSDDFAAAVGAAVGSAPTSTATSRTAEFPDMELPLAAFDDAAQNAVADAGFMPGTALPAQKALLTVVAGDVQVSNDGKNVALVHQLRIDKGVKSKGSFFNRAWVFGRTKESQQTVTNMLKGYTSAVSLASPTSEMVRAAQGKNLEPLRQYAKSFVDKVFIGGVGLNKNQDGVVNGNTLSGYEPATPENLAALDKLIANAKKRSGGIRPTPSPLAG